MENDIKNRIRSAVRCLCKHQKENLEKFRKNSQKIYLGRLFGLGAWFQYFLAKELFEDTRFYSVVLVDCPVTFKGRKQPLYPDILVIDENNTLKGLIDVKLDFGYVKPEEFGFKKIKKGDHSSYTYNRKDNKFLKKYNDFFNAQQFQYKVKGVLDETEEKEIRIPKQVHKIAIILMGHVNNHNNYDGYKEAMEDAGFKFLHILWDGDVRHPNDEENVRRIEKEIKENNDIEKVFRPLFAIKMQVRLKREQAPEASEGH